MSGTATSSAALFFNYWFILFELVTGITFAGMLIAVTVPMPPVSYRMADAPCWLV